MKTAQNKVRNQLRFLALPWLLSACSDAKSVEVLEAQAPGLLAQPHWLTFTCVEPGCDTTLVAAVKVIGDRALAVKRVVLSDRDRNDFTVSSNRGPPFILEVGEIFEVEVRYQPTGDPRLGDVKLLISYTDAAAGESEERLPPGELEVPLVRRLVGEPKLAVGPGRVSFGAVLVGTRNTQMVTIQNAGFGNVGLVIEEITSDLPEVLIENVPTLAILPGQDHLLSLTYAPIDEAFIEGTLKVVSADPLAEPGLVQLLGTSIEEPSIAVRPATGVDFGEVPVGMMAIAKLGVENRGAERLLIYGIELSGAANIQISFPRSATTATITALSSSTITLTLDAQIASQISANLRILSNDPDGPVLDVPVRGLLVQPQVLVTPLVLEFGGVPRGWTVSRRIEVQNDGFGELEIRNVGFVLGSSDLYTFKTAPQVPASLDHGQRIGFDVEFRSETEAHFTGIVAVDTNDPETPFVEVTLTATGASCLDGCPIVNGTPSCLNGVCEIGMCNPGFYDSDQEPSTGCECAEIDQDPSEFCTMSPYIGSLSDEGDRRTFTGIVPTETDEDFVRFFGLDESQFLSDDYQVEIRLESTDPGIQFCAWRAKKAAHANECIFEGMNCPSNRYYEDDGSLGPDDSADYLVKVFRAPGSAATCTTYTLFMRNG